MRALLFSLALLWSLTVGAADISSATQGGDKVTLTDEPCPVEVLSRVAQGTRGYYRRAHAVVDGVEYTACWREMNGSAHLMYEDGDQGLVPMQDFKKELRT